MNLVDLLPDEDLSLIEEYRDNYAGVSSENNALPMREILQVWSDAKQELYRVLGENFIVEKEIEITKDSYDIQRELEGNADVERFKTNYDIAIHRQRDKNNDIDAHFWEILGLTSYNHLSTNSYNGDTFKISTPEGREITVQKGAKISRILGKISKAFNIEGYDAYNLASSKVFNQKKIKGQLCLSIHPMDYMTMSDNNSDWSSCMSWQEEGCYRQGTVEMMNSAYVVVAYLKSKNNMKLFYNRLWNNKRWRNLFIVTPDLITSVKGYPYQSSELDTVCIHWLEELIATNAPSWGSYEEEILEVTPSDTNFEVNSYNLDDTSIMLEFNTYQMYNDFGNSNTVHLTLNKSYRDPDASQVISITYSGDSQCMCCGSTMNYFDGAEYLFCEECDDRDWCTCCNEYYPREAMHEVDGDYYCDDCFVEECYWDELDQEYHYKGNAAEVRITRGEEELEPHTYEMYDEETGKEKKELLSLPEYEEEISVYDLNKLKNVAEIRVRYSPYFSSSVYYINIYEQDDEVQEALCYQAGMSI